MSKGWKIYAAVVSLLTVVAITGGGETTVIDVLIGVVANLLLLVLFPWGIVLLVRAVRHKDTEVSAP